MVLDSHPKYNPRTKKTERTHELHIKVTNFLYIKMKNSLNNNLLIFSFNYFPRLQVKHFMNSIEFIVAKLFEYNFCLKESIAIHNSYISINLKLIQKSFWSFPKITNIKQCSTQDVVSTQ